jgi:hypothetical protein
MNALQTTRYAAVIAAGLLCLGQAAPASAGSPPPYPPGWSRHQHHARHHAVLHARHHAAQHARHHYAGPRYVVVDRLPRGCRHVVYRGQPYYYRGANWYQPYGGHFVAVAPPAGVIFIDGRAVMLAAQVPLARW